MVKASRNFLLKINKLAINKILVIVPLLITYLVGPLGIFIYWLIRIFYAKSINLIICYIIFILKIFTIL